MRLAPMSDAEHAETRIRIDAPVDVVYRLAAEIELWPAFVRQISCVKVLRRSPSSPLARLIAVRGRQGWLPIGWRAVQRLEPEIGRITLRQVTPLTAGTTARWTITAAVDGLGTDVVVVAQPVVHLPLVGRLIAERVIGPRIGRPFMASILRDLKHVAEGGSLAGSA
jgi:hypothetical protein